MQTTSTQPVITHRLEFNQNAEECLWRRYINGRKTTVSYLIPYAGTRPNDIPDEPWRKAQAQYNHWQTYF